MTTGVVLKENGVEDDTSVDEGTDTGAVEDTSVPELEGDDTGVVAQGLHVKSVVRVM